MVYSEIIAKCELISGVHVYMVLKTRVFGNQKIIGGLCYRFIYMTGIRQEITYFFFMLKPLQRLKYSCFLIKTTKNTLLFLSFYKNTFIFCWQRQKFLYMELSIRYSWWYKSKEEYKYMKNSYIFHELKMLLGSRVLA